MQLEFANRPVIIVERKTQYLSQNLQFLGGALYPLLPITGLPSTG